VDNGVVADAYTITNDGAGLLVCAVDNCPVLDIDLISDPDGVYIPPHHGVKPYTAVISNDYVAYHRGIRGDKAVISKLRADSIDGKNYGHGFQILTFGARY
jgi:hypothetical protein